MTQPHEDQPKQRRLGLHLLAIVGGLALLSFLIWSVGVGEILKHLRQIGWQAPLILLPYLGVALCDAKGWACAIPPTSPARKTPLWRISLARLAGEAVNNLTPTANVGGEPVKVYMLQAHGLTTDAGLASVVAAKTALTISQVVFILLGLPFFLYRLGWIDVGWWLVLPLLGLAYGFVVLVVRWQRRGLMGLFVRGLQRLFPRWPRLSEWRERAQRIDAHLLHFYDSNQKGFLASILYHFFGWLLGAVEVLFFFHLMGVSVSPLDALIVESMVQPMTAAGLIIPGALGVQEAGGVFLCRLLGLDDGASLTLMALKRAREAVYNLVGLTVIMRVTGALLPWNSHSV
jgi:glycosyltransferase 2 family protein